METLNPLKHIIIHMQIDILPNENVRFGDNSNSVTPFFSDIAAKMIQYNKFSENAAIKWALFPLIHETNLLPFENAILLTPETVISDNTVSDYIIENINTDQGISLIEELSGIYKKVTLCRIYSHNPGKMKFIVHCVEKTKNILKLSFKTVLFKRNLYRIHEILYRLLQWDINKAIYFHEDLYETNIGIILHKDYFAIFEKICPELITSFTV